MAIQYDINIAWTVTGCDNDFAIKTVRLAKEMDMISVSVQLELMFQIYICKKKNNNNNK
jgi:hypothetical protein